MLIISKPEIYCFFPLTPFTNCHHDIKVDSDFHYSDEIEFENDQGGMEVFKDSKMICLVSI